MRNLWGFELNQSCGNCRFIGKNNTTQDLSCCRYPPSIPINGSSVLPETNKEFWCGEWQPRFTSDDFEQTR